MSSPDQKAVLQWFVARFSVAFLVPLSYKLYRETLPFSSNRTGKASNCTGRLFPFPQTVPENHQLVPGETLPFLINGTGKSSNCTGRHFPFHYGTEKSSYCTEKRSKKQEEVSKKKVKTQKETKNEKEVKKTKGSKKNKRK